MKEGLHSASEIKSYNIDIQIIDEASLNLFINDIDIVLLGADIVTKDYFINKIGSYFIYLIAKENDVPLYVITDSYKFIDEAELTDSEKQNLLQEKAKPKEEILDTNYQNVTVFNYYFEKIPLKDVILVTESGVFSQAELISKFDVLKQ
jgi:translation initiation factor 2B subunit (eIF-2B alpha/beta/delta family)